MSLKKTTRKTTTKKAPDFQRLLQAADKAAQTLIIHGGVNPQGDPNGDGEEQYETLVREITNSHIRRLSESHVDDHVHYDMYFAHLQVAHLIGLCMGRRLAGVGLDAFGRQS